MAVCFQSAQEGGLCDGASRRSLQTPQEEVGSVFSLRKSVCVRLSGRRLLPPPPFLLLLSFVPPPAGSQTGNRCSLPLSFLSFPSFVLVFTFSSLLLPSSHRPCCNSPSSSSCMNQFHLRCLLYLCTFISSTIPSTLIINK